MVKNNNKNYIDCFSDNLNTRLKIETDNIIYSLKHNLLNKAKSNGNKNDVKFISSININKYKSFDKFVEYVRSNISFTIDDDLIFACLGARVWFLLDGEYGYSYATAEDS